MVERVGAVAVAAMGLFAVIANKRFARASIVSSREFFGDRLPEGSRRYRFTIAYSRTIAIIAGSLMFVFGTLDVLGIDWRAVYR